MNTYTHIISIKCTSIMITNTLQINLTHTHTNILNLGQKPINTKANLFSVRALILSYKHTHAYTAISYLVLSIQLFKLVGSFFVHVLTLTAIVSVNSPIDPITDWSRKEPCQRETNGLCYQLQQFSLAPPPADIC